MLFPDFLDSRLASFWGLLSPSVCVDVGGTELLTPGGPSSRRVDHGLTRLLLVLGLRGSVTGAGSDIGTRFSDLKSVLKSPAPLYVVLDLSVSNLHTGGVGLFLFYKSLTSF